MVVRVIAVTEQDIEANAAADSDVGEASPPIVEEASVDIHKPKAAHSVQEFLIEIGTIICGILIALSLEQGVETLRTHHEAEETDRALQTEVRTDLDEAIQGAVANGCFRTRIADLTGKLTAPGQSWKGEYEPAKPDPFGGRSGMAGSIILTPLGTMTHNLWDSPAVTSGLSHLDVSRAHRYSDIYRYVTALQAVDDDFTARVSELQPLSFDQELDPAARRTYLSALARLDQDIHFGYNITGFLIERARQNGIEADARDVGERVAAVRKEYGDCVRPYSPAPAIRAEVQNLDRVGIANRTR